MLYVFDKILTYRVSPTHESVEFVKVFLRGPWALKMKRFIVSLASWLGDTPKHMTLKLPEFSGGPSWPMAPVTSPSKMGKTHPVNAQKMKNLRIHSFEEESHLPNHRVYVLC